MNSVQLTLILSLPLSLSFSLFLSLCICIYEFYSIKPCHFTETKIYVKLDSKDAKTASSYHIKPGTIYAQWNYLTLKNHQQTPNKIKQNQDEKKKKRNRNSTFYSHEFIHFIADLIRPLFEGLEETKNRNITRFETNVLFFIFI